MGEDDEAEQALIVLLCRCGHSLTETDLHFCGYCGAPIQYVTGRRQAPAAVASGRRAALAALASERNPAPAEPVTDRLVAPPRAAAVAPSRPAAGPSVTPAAGPVVLPVVEAPLAAPAAATAPPPIASSPAAPPADPDSAAAPAVVGDPTAAAAAASAASAASAAGAASVARVARAARATRASRPARVARVARITTASPTGAPTTAQAAAPAAGPAPEPPAPTAMAATTAAAASPAAAAREAPAAPPGPARSEAPSPSGAVVPGEATTRAPDGAAVEPPVEPSVAVAPSATVLGRRTWPAWLCVAVIAAAAAAQTALRLHFTYPGWLYWLPAVLVPVVALARAARFTAGLVGIATAAVTAWWAVDHVVSTARSQALGYDVSQSTISVPVLVATVGSVPLAAALCALVDGHVRSAVREWAAPRSGVHAVRAAAVVLAVVAAVFPVARAVTAEGGFGVLVAARDQVLYPGYPTPGQIADRMHATSLARGRPVSMTCSYAPADAASGPSYQCVAVPQGGDGTGQVHDGIRSTAYPDGTFSCADFTRGVDRRLC